MSTNQAAPRLGVSNDIQERTLKVTNIPEKVTKNLLFELFLQCGPVRNVVHKPDFAFIEFENQVSVGYSLALMDGVQLFGKKLELQPKIPNEETFAYLQRLKEYEYTFASQPHNWWSRFGKNGTPIPPHICSAVLNKLDRDIPMVPLPGVYGSPSNSNSANQSEPSSNFSSRRGNQSHSFNNNSTSSSTSFHNSQHHHHHHHPQQQQQQQQQYHQPRSYHHLQPPPPPSRPPSVIALDSPPSRDSSRYNYDDRERFDNRRREDNSYRGSEPFRQTLRSEVEYRRDDDYHRRRQRDYNDRDGGHHGPDRRIDHSPYERYNPYPRPDHRSHHQSHPDLHYQQPNLNYHQQQQLLHDERRNSFPTYRDHRLPSNRQPHARY
ncbi:RNA-binding protein 7-like [Panonychus citri]|uniref:RNA-binding protein 7-like n=1 Tax=Panonychus citri TaxID=50023 RepID=UPI002307AB03|nr:RNA-binding protein 7-like [Panonychus citri]